MNDQVGNYLNVDTRSFSECAITRVASSSNTNTGRPSRATSAPATIEAGNTVPVASPR